jgi:hypothetical protein
MDNSKINLNTRSKHARLELTTFQHGIMITTKIFLKNNFKLRFTKNLS